MRADDAAHAVHLLRKRLAASYTSEALRQSMLATLFTTLSAFLQVHRMLAFSQTHAYVCIRCACLFYLI